MKRLLLALAASLLVSAPGYSENIVLEAESFAKHGGWFVDHESFNKTGSASLLAHGCGRPVEDAVTSIDIKDTGVYHIWVNTFNWTAPWYDGDGPGAFQVLVNGKAPDGCKVLGTKGNAWGWQYAGVAELSAHNAISIHDLTGFDGRVDALYISKNEIFPAEGVKRHHPLAKHSGYDLVVAGGGIAGCATALAAARLGLKVAIVNNMPWLGGNAVFGVNVCGLFCDNLYKGLGAITCELIGADPDSRFSKDSHIMQNPVQNLGRIKTDAALPSWDSISNKVEHSQFMRTFENLPQRERDAAEEFELERIEREKKELAKAWTREQLLRQEGVDVFLNLQIYAVEVKGGKIKSLTARSLKTGDDVLISGELFSDCTGDGDVAILAGAEYMYGREPAGFAKESLAPAAKDNKTLGSTINWRAVRRLDPGTFPDVCEIPWAMQCDSSYHIKTRRYTWQWETGLDINNAEEPELVRDNYLRAVYGNWAYLKNHIEEYKDLRLDYFNYVNAKRESRRIIGDYILNQNDIIGHIEYPDASFTTTWPIDLHSATAENEARFKGWEWQTHCTNGRKDCRVGAYHVPYRCLCCKGLDNLFLGGRAISVTHVALGTVRVQATLGMAGEVAGMAAYLCRKHGCTPSDIHSRYFSELAPLMSKGIPTL